MKKRNFYEKNFYLGGIRTRDLRIRSRARCRRATETFKNLNSHRPYIVTKTASTGPTSGRRRASTGLQDSFYSRASMYTSVNSRKIVT